MLNAPYEISHTETDLKELSKRIKGHGGKNDVRVVMEATGAYGRPILYYLLDEGIFVSEINPLAMRKYRADINFRGVKNDRRCGTGKRRRTAGGVVLGKGGIPV